MSEPKPAFTVWKFYLQLGTNFMSIPSGGKFLSVQMQDGRICVWVQCDENAPRVNRQVDVAVTGGRLTGTEKYIGTFQDGPYVGHAFEIVE